MCPDDKHHGIFYSNFKVHKPHAHKEAPPVRPIVIGSGSIPEGIATFVEHYIHKATICHETYLQDTTDFLRLIEKVTIAPS